MKMTVQKEESESTINVPPQGAHYVDNKKFYDALVEYKTMVDTALAEGKEQPIVPNYIGECFIKIATHLSYKGNFINYTFKDDMISDGIDNCLTAVAKFDPTKSSNPFAYYTQIIYYAFIRRIQKEKKQQIIKYKLIENMDLDELVTQEQDAGDFNNQYLEYMKRNIDLLDEEKLESKPKKSKSKKNNDIDLSE